jgi:hypothetical protein
MYVKYTYWNIVLVWFSFTYTHIFTSICYKSLEIRECIYFERDGSPRPRAPRIQGALYIRTNPDTFSEDFLKTVCSRLAPQLGLSGSVIVYCETVIVKARSVRNVRWMKNEYRTGLGRGPTPHPVAPPDSPLVINRRVGGGEGLSFCTSVSICSTLCLTPKIY